MRIEVLIGLENPEFYSINKPRTVIGSDLSCDIVINEDQISRKHLIVIQEEDQYFVVDQGSTNGSYLNEERLIPGRRVEFTSYFPVRLGSSVLLSLVSDEEATDETGKIIVPFPEESLAPKKSSLETSNRASSDKTTVLSLKDLQASSTKGLVKQRQEYKKKVESKKKGTSVKKKKKKTKERNFRSVFFHMVVVGILAPAIYLTFFDDLNKTSPTGASISESADGGKSGNSAIPNGPTVPKAPPFLTLLEHFEQSSKCISPEEILLCESIEGAETLPWGVTSQGEHMIVMIDATPYWTKASSLLPPPVSETGMELTPDQQKFYESELWELAIGFFLVEGIKNDSFKSLGNKKLTFAFFLLQNGFPALEASIAITPKSLVKVRSLASPQRFSYIGVSRAKVMNFRKGLYDINL